VQRIHLFMILVGRCSLAAKAAVSKTVIAGSSPATFAILFPALFSSLFSACPIRPADTQSRSM
ncbi:MAG: hypothetical protein RL268_1474, partial [Pseudomonadota bacterium]